MLGLSMIVGERLRELRKVHGLSRRELAEHVQIGEANVQRYEDGKSDAGSEIVVKIARYFGVSTDYLLGLSDNPANQGGDLSLQELNALAAWREGNIREAIKVIVDDE